jgi:hypothetical protein
MSPWYRDDASSLDQPQDPSIRDTVLKSRSRFRRQSRSLL